MILLALAFLLILVFLYDTRIFIYALMVFYVLFDMMDGFYDDEKIFAAIRYIIPLSLILVFVLKESVFKKSDFIFVLYYSTHKVTLLSQLKHYWQ
jgi:hypothetical protein